MQYSVNISNPSLLPNTDKLTITNLHVDASVGAFLVSILNSGSSDLVITDVYIDDFSVNLEKSIVVPTNSKIGLVLNLTEGITVGYAYQSMLLSSEGCLSTYCIIVA